MKKIKGSSGAIKMKYLLFSFVIAVLATLPLRVYQLLVLIDPTTGFYSSTDATVVALSAALVIFCLLFLVLSYISKEIPSPKLPTGKNPLLGVTSLLMAVALMADVIAVEREVVPSHQATTAMFFRLLRENLSGSLGVFTVLQVVFAIFAVLYFCPLYIKISFAVGAVSAFLFIFFRTKPENKESFDLFSNAYYRFVPDDELRTLIFKKEYKKIKARLKEMGIQGNFVPEFK